VSSLREYFSTALMIGLYVWIFNPKNRDKFEQHRDFVNENNEHNKDIAK